MKLSLPRQFSPKYFFITSDVSGYFLPISAINLCLKASFFHSSIFKSFLLNQLLSYHWGTAFRAFHKVARRSSFMSNSRSAFRTHAFSTRTCTCSGATHSSSLRSSHTSASSPTRSAAPGRTCSVSSWQPDHHLSRLLVTIIGEGDRPLIKRQGRFCSPFKNRPIPRASSMAPMQFILYYYHRRNPRPPPKTLPRPPPHGSPPRPTPKTGPYKGPL